MIFAVETLNNQTFDFPGSKYHPTVWPMLRRFKWDAWNDFISWRSHNEYKRRGREIMFKKKLYIKKGVHFMIFAIEVVINFSENQHLTFSRSRCSPFSRWPFKVTQGQTENAILFATYDFLYLCSIVTKAISHTETLFFSRWPWSDLSGHKRSNCICILMPSYLCSIVTIALSRTENLFFGGWPWSDLSRSRKVKLIIPSDLRLITCFHCSIVTIALSRTETLFFLDSDWVWIE